MSELCKNCGKEKSSGRAGSITAYFFEHNYCQCEQRKQKNLRLSRKATAPGKSERICLACGKSCPEDQRAGSFTAFLFKELRCQCSKPKFAVAQSKRTQVAERFKQKRQTARRHMDRLRHGEAIPIGPGTIIGGTFKIASIIGEGGMGTVYLAQHRTLPQKFALKILAQSLVSEQYWQRFQAEAKTLAALKHPNLVNVYDLGIHENSVFYYSMDYLEGRNLEDILANNGPQTLERTIEIFLAVLDGLAYAHRNGIVHRDIKPANIFICNKGTSAAEVKILDFGIAKLVKGDNAGQELTAAGEVFGSPFYMSPEQCMGNAVDARSDIYSVGCSLFESLSGFVPFEADSSLEIALMHEENTPPLISDVMSNQLPSSVDAVIAKCLAKNPRDRYQSAKELSLDLERIKEGKDVAEYRSAGEKKAHVNTEAEHGKNLTGPLLIGGAVATFLLMGGYFLWNTMLTPARIETVRTEKTKAIKLFLSDEAYTVDQSYILESRTNYTDKLTPQHHTNIKQYLAQRKTPYSHLSLHGELQIFDFPADISLGTITYKKGNKFTQVNANGQVEIPVGSIAQFVAGDSVKEYPDLIKFFRTDDFTCLEFTNMAKKNPQLGPNLVRLTKTKELVLAGSNIEDEDLRWLDKMKSVIFLDLSNTKVTGDGFSKSKIFTRLDSYIINGMKNITPVLEKISPERQLRFISIGATKPTARDFALLSKLSGVKSLIIYGTTLKDENIKSLVRMQSLRELNLRFCKGLTKYSLVYFKQFKNLRNLTIPSNILSPQDMAALRKALPKTRIDQL